MLIGDKMKKTKKVPKPKKIKGVPERFDVNNCTPMESELYSLLLKARMKTSASEHSKRR